MEMNSGLPINFSNIRWESNSRWDKSQTAQYRWLISVICVSSRDVQIQGCQGTCSLRCRFHSLRTQPNKTTNKMEKWMHSCLRSIFYNIDCYWRFIFHLNRMSECLFPCIHFVFSQAVVLHHEEQIVYPRRESYLAQIPLVLTETRSIHEPFKALSSFY